MGSAAPCVVPADEIKWGGNGCTPPMECALPDAANAGILENFRFTYGEYGYTKVTGDTDASPWAGTWMYTYLDFEMIYK